MTKYVFTFMCKQLGTGDFVDIVVEVESYTWFGALQLAINAFDCEYRDTHEPFEVRNGRL